MNVETLDDVLHDLASLIDVWGACKHDGSGDGCEHS